MNEEMPKTGAHYLRNRDEWIRMVVDCPDLTHVQVRVAMHLAMRMNIRDRDCWPSIKTIAESVGCSQRSVITALDVLRDEGFVGMERKRNAGNRYWLMFKWQ